MEYILVLNYFIKFLNKCSKEMFGGEKILMYELLLDNL